MAGMAAAKDGCGESGEVDLLRFEIGEGLSEALQVCRVNGDGEIHVPGELGGAVQDARLSAHEERLNLPPPERRKDSGNRAQGHTFPPKRGSSPTGAEI